MAHPQLMGSALPTSTVILTRETTFGRDMTPARDMILFPGRRRSRTMLLGTWPITLVLCRLSGDLPEVVVTGHSSAQWWTPTSPFIPRSTSQSAHIGGRRQLLRAMLSVSTLMRARSAE